MLPERLDTTLAFKAICLAESLSGTDKRVAGAILDHFNRTTGQCDPSLDRIAGILSISRRTVIRSINRLVRMKLLRRDRHGGHLNRNSYQPLWPTFREREARWTKRKVTRSRRKSATDPSPEQGRESHLLCDRPGTETLISNPSKETLRSIAPSAHSRPPDWSRVSSRREDEIKGAASSSEAARVAAERRWHTDLHTRFAGSPSIYEKIVIQIDAELRFEATEAEISRHGAGLKLILQRLLAHELKPSELCQESGKDESF